MVVQKIVIKVSMQNARKGSKALKTAVGFCGVISASLDGDDKIVVVGNGVDSVALMRKLWKRMCYAELISLGEEKKEEEKKEEKGEASNSEPEDTGAAKYCVEPTSLPYHCRVMQPYPYVVCEPTYNPNSCIVM